MLSRISFIIIRNIYTLIIKLERWDSGKWRRKLFTKKKTLIKPDILEDQIFIEQVPLYIESKTSTKIERVRETPKIVIDSNTRDLLKQSIVISIPFYIERPDLEFVSFSISDHYPIYRYIGSNFKNFDLLYTEMISVDIDSEQIPTEKTSILRNI